MCIVQVSECKAAIFKGKSERDRERQREWGGGKRVKGKKKHWNVINFFFVCGMFPFRDTWTANRAQHIKQVNRMNESNVHVIFCASLIFFCSLSCICSVCIQFQCQKMVRNSDKLGTCDWFSFSLCAHFFKLVFSVIRWNRRKKMEKGVFKLCHIHEKRTRKLYLENK